jgi:hypothetical protein
VAPECNRAFFGLSGKRRSKLDRLLFFSTLWPNSVAFWKQLEKLLFVPLGHDSSNRQDET